MPSAAPITRKDLIAALNQDLEREYQAVIAYVVYSQVLKGAQYMNIAGELEKHAHEELQHAITLAYQIDYLGGMPATVPKPVKTSEKATEMLRFDLESEVDTIRNYRERVVSVRRWASTPWPSRSARSWSRSRITSSRWRRHSASTRPIPASRSRRQRRSSNKPGRQGASRSGS